MINKRIAVVGIQGLPAKYGGFETLVLNLENGLPEGVELTVWCSSKEYAERPSRYGKANLKYLPFRANGWQGIIFDMLAIFRSQNYDKILVLGVNGALALLIPHFARRTVLNIGGLDYQRSKWGYGARKVILLLNTIAINRASELISDNEKIKHYLLREHNRTSTLIGYGYSIFDKVARKGRVQSGDYFLNISRIQSDNNCHVILEAFARNTKEHLIMIGNFSLSRYGRDLFRLYSNVANITLMEAFYDKVKLKELLGGAKGFVHGHSAGGTNPILVDYMSQCKPILSFLNGFNQFTMGRSDYSWSSEEELLEILGSFAFDTVCYRERLKVLNWPVVSRKYFDLLCQ